MKRIILLLISVAFSGCAVSQMQEQSPARKMMFGNAQAIRKIVPGMSQREVHKMIGEDVVIGYEYMAGTDTPEYKPLTVQNPYRTETLKRQHLTFVVEYFFTHINQADGVVTDDELTPLVFEKGYLVGKGWPYFKKLTAQYRLK